MRNEQQSSEVNRERYATYQQEAAMDRLANEAMRNRPTHAWRASARGIAIWMRAMLNGQAITGTAQGWQESGRRLIR
jgi:hypothetical protein